MAFDIPSFEVIHFKTALNFDWELIISIFKVNWVFYFLACDKETF